MVVQVDVEAAHRKHGHPCAPAAGSLSPLPHLAHQRRC
jgi:hypothetical protein